MKILLLSHGLFAQELLNSCMMIDPEAEDVCALCLTEGGIESFSEKLNLYLKKNENESILFFCDLKHGSPYNQLLINMIEIKVKKYKIITGMNLPMVLQAIIKLHTSTDIDDIVKASSEAGVEGITVYEPK